MSRFADVTTDTPHGPRPVPDGHKPTDDLPAKRGVSPILMLGGVGLALTIGALAARAAYGAVSDDDEPKRRPMQGPRRRLAPGYAALDADARRAMRSRANADFVDYDERAEELRAAAMRRRKQRRRPPQRPSNPSVSFADNVGTVARNITALVAAATTALEGFRTVSAHSDDVMREFNNAAARVKEFLGMDDDTPAATADETVRASRQPEQQDNLDQQDGDRRPHTL